MFMFFVFPVALLLTSTVWMRSAWNARSVCGASSVAATLLAAFTLCYVVALAQVSLDPWFDDNGVREFIAWRYRWGWAAMFAGWYTIVIVPLAFGFRALVLLVNNKP
ncbi:hypothetical protein ASD00_35060 [Ensifer sp. Root31]|uniref:hypothetical protein n=1 Tax=Ensifer sp. Root31 TaxID=1736512 RepID=UPI00070C077C|nr:hypothetical protein [Ensifer sp. Root31]KQU81771.1 hypothetical protein ASD00_35060 [Ensifer sp. Root31]